MIRTLRISARIGLWTILIGVSIYFFPDNVIACFYGYRSPIFGQGLFNKQFWVVMHMVGGTMALLLGPVQFRPFIRNRFVSFHRLSGKMVSIPSVYYKKSIPRQKIIS